jgi:hypothetical protein
MTKSRQKWLSEAAAKAEGGVWTGLVPMAKVQNLDAEQRRRNGEFQHMALDKALAGEAKGLWTVVEAMGGDRP